MNIVIPAAGAGSRFVQAGYNIPKPFIPIKGKAMLEWVIDNISSPTDRVYVLTRLDHLTHLRGTSLLYRDNISFIPVEQPTQGATCTVLRARQFIDNSAPLIIANSDQYVVYKKPEWLKQQMEVAASILTFQSDDPKWSYAEVSDSGRVRRVAEKEVISPHATVGIYYFREGKLFCQAADRMMYYNRRVNGEFYVCPVFNEMVESVDVGIFPVDEMYGLGTPQDLEANYEFIGS